MAVCQTSILPQYTVTKQILKAVLSQREPRDAAVNFDANRSLRQHGAIFIAMARLSYQKIGKITANGIINMSIYCLQIHYLTHYVCPINISDCSEC